MPSIAGSYPALDLTSITTSKSPSPIATYTHANVRNERPKVSSRLLKYDCVTLLPHLGGLTHDSMKVGVFTYVPTAYSATNVSENAQNHALIAMKRIDGFFSTTIYS